MNFRFENSVGARARAMLLVGSIVLLALAASAGTALGAGELSPMSGKTGCISTPRFVGPCRAGHHLNGVDTVVLSPDGKNLYGSAYFGNAITVFRRNPATGGFVQLKGKAGCLSEKASLGCTVLREFGDPQGLVISSDGRSAYAASGDDDAVAIFDRNPHTGALTQKPGTAGCISADGSGGACQLDPTLLGPTAMAISPDGRNVYAVGFQTMTAFDRDPGTGALAKKPGAAGCLSEIRTGLQAGCQPAQLLLEGQGIAISPDGRTLYSMTLSPSRSAAPPTGMLSSFDRDPQTGALTQKPGAEGCLGNRPPSGCGEDSRLDGTTSVSVSPDGRSAYVGLAGRIAIAIFDRNAQTGALSAKPGPSGCLSSKGAKVGCAMVKGFEEAGATALSPDGRNLYATSVGSTVLEKHGQSNSATLWIFDRDPASGTLRLKSGKAGCITAATPATAAVLQMSQCRRYTGIGGAANLIVAPKGNSVYLAGISPGSITVLKRAGGHR